MKKIYSLILVLAVFFTSCAFALEPAPYAFTARMEMDRSLYGQDASLVFRFTNKSWKDVSYFIIRFFLFDDEGNPPDPTRVTRQMTIRMNVDGGETIENAISLENQLNELPEYPYEVDYPYVSKIVYTDGSEWSDPSGLRAPL